MQGLNSESQNLGWVAGFYIFVLPYYFDLTLQDGLNLAL